MKFKQLMFENLDEPFAENDKLDELYDDFFTDDFMIDSSTNDATEGPRVGSDTGVADMLLDAINDEFETIRKYNSLVATLRAELVNNSIYESFIHVLNDINQEENIHVGQLQEMLKQISPNASLIQRGVEEGREQLQFKDGKLQVQCWDTSNSQTEKTAISQVDNVCTLDNVDDEM